MTIEIEYGIPLLGRTKCTGYPFKEMKVGGSFMIPTSQEPEKKSIRSMLKYQWRISGRKYATRSVVEDGIDGIRIWRIV